MLLELAEAEKPSMIAPRPNRFGGRTDRWRSDANRLSRMSPPGLTHQSTHSGTAVFSRTELSLPTGDAAPSSEKIGRL